METTNALLKNTVQRRIRESLERIEKCLSLLNEDQIWHQFNKETPSVGNLVLHLVGNIRQWNICTFSEAPDRRVRDKEFNTATHLPTKDLFEAFQKTVLEAMAITKNLTDDQLNDSYQVQGFQETGVNILIHVVEHLSYHTGQIALHTKILADKDLGFYAGQDLNSTQPTES